MQPEGSLATVGFDDYEAGVIAGKRAAEAGATNILCVNSEPGNVGLEERCRGMADGAPDATVTQAGITSVDPAAFQQQLTAALKADESIDSVITSGPVEADLAMQVLQDQGFADRVKLATFDLSPEVLKAIDAGKTLRPRPAAVPHGLPAGRVHHQPGPLPGQPVGRVLTGPGVVTQETAAQIDRAVEAGCSLSEALPEIDHEPVGPARDEPPSRDEGDSGPVRHPPPVHAATRDRGAILGTILLWLIFAFLGAGNGFITIAGTAGMLEVAAQVGIVGTAVALLMIAGQFDLSVGSTVGATGMVLALALSELRLPVWLAVVLALALGSPSALSTACSWSGRASPPSSSPSPRSSCCAAPPSP